MNHCAPCEHMPSRSRNFRDLKVGVSFMFHATLGLCVGARQADGQEHASCNAAISHVVRELETS
eukprot:984908-Amphidinium_carterae.1